MARIRLPLLRRISQIFFLVLFLGLLIFTSLHATAGGTAEIHLRGPVRLFFEWDPLVALANALAGHALYRGLLWSLVIVVPRCFWGDSSAAGSAPWARCSILSATCHRRRNAASSASSRIAISAGRRSSMWC